LSGLGMAAATVLVSRVVSGAIPTSAGLAAAIHRGGHGERAAPYYLCRRENRLQT
jgi:hypothetical protein